MSLWVETAKVIGPIISPFIALAGAIYLYFRKQRSDREDARRKEKLDLYSETLSLAGETRKSIYPQTTIATETGISGFISHVHKIHIVAPAEIFSAALHLAHQLSILQTEATNVIRQKIKGEGSGELDPLLHKAVTDAEIKLIEAMRADIESYTPPAKTWRSLLER